MERLSMGSLAKIGIARGKKVPVEGLVESSDRVELDEFGRRCLGSFGFARIADKLIQGAELSVDEIEVLLTKSSLPVLMKLVELKVPREDRLAAYPVIALPLESWLNHEDPDKVCRKAIARLAAIPYRSLLGIVELNDFVDLDHMWPDIIGQIKESRPGLTLLGPSLESIIRWISVNESLRSKTLRAYRLEKILVQLKRMGFDRLRESPYRGALKMLAGAGFRCSLLTRVDRYPEPALLARELHRINRIAQSSDLIERWSPGVTSGRGRRALRGAALDLRILRSMAVGAICLNHIPLRRAFSSYLSLEAITFLRHVGANEFVFGAVDRETQRYLSVHSMRSLQEILPLAQGA